MIANIANNNDIIFTNITPWEEELLDKHFSAHVPNQRYINTSEQSWDGVYRKYNRKTRRIARPLLAELRLLAHVKDLSLAIEDHRGPDTAKVLDISQVNNNLLPGITLKDFQVDGIKAVYGADCGVFHVGTSGGKGELIAAICKVIECPTVIMSEQRIVVDQLVKRLQLRMVCEEPGMFYAGKTPNGQMILVGTIQSLVLPKALPDPPVKEKCKNDKDYEKKKAAYDQKCKAYFTRKKNAKNLHSIIGKCDMLMVDECDLAVSDTWKKLFRYWYHGRRRYGFTGTLNDPDKPIQALVLKEHIGSTIYRQKVSDIQAAGLAVPLVYYALAFGEDGQKDDASAYDIAIDEQMVNNERFHLKIAEICARYPDEGTVILVDRDNLGHALNELIPGSVFYHGKSSAKNRKAMIEKFESRECKVFIGGKNVRRGMDLKGGCENLIIATGGRLRSEFDQQLGRARRLNSLGRARVFDFFHLGNKYLYEHSRKRLKFIHSMEYPSRVVFRDGAVESTEFLRSRFRKPRKLIPLAEAFTL